MIQIQNLSKTFENGGQLFYALKEVSISIELGEFVAIMGPSGSGKSTLMNMLGLLDVPTSGKYSLCGKETQQLSEDERAQFRSRYIGFVFQQFQLLKRITAKENVMLPAIYTVRPKSTEEKAVGLLEKVGLSHRINHKPNELSGGQQQRVAIARALINEAPILLADEPTGNLDSKSQEEILSLFKSLNKSGITVILITHEEEVATHASRVIRMKDGEILSDSKQKETQGQASTHSIKIDKKRSLKDQVLQSPVHIKQALQSIYANKLRSFLSVLGILIGVAAVITMLSLGNGAKKAIQTQLSSLGSNLLVLRPANTQSRGVGLEAGAVSNLTIADSLAVAKLSAVKEVSPTVFGRAQVAFRQNNINTQVLGVGALYTKVRTNPPEYGRFFTQKEVNERAKVVLLGTTVAKMLFPDGTGGFRNPVGETVKINRIRFLVIGVFKEKGSASFRDEDDMVTIPYTTAMKRVLGRDYLSSMDISIESTEVMPRAQVEILELMEKRYQNSPEGEGFEIRNLSEIQQTLAATTETLSVFISFIGVISLVVGGIGIMNIMLVTVTERTKEIGLRKAIGAYNSDILLQFLVEAIVVSVIGGGVGVMLGCLISWLLSVSLGWAIVISTSSIVISLGFSMSIGLVFGFLPAKKAASLHPIEALRYE